MGQPRSTEKSIKAVAPRSLLSDLLALPPDAPQSP